MATRWRLRVAFLTALCSTAALAQSAGQLGSTGLGNTGAPGSAVQVGIGGTPGPGGMPLAPGPAGSQAAGVQNLTSQAGTLLQGCTIPSATFNRFAIIQPGTTTQNTTPLPQTTLSGC